MIGKVLIVFEIYNNKNERNTLLIFSSDLVNINLLSKTRKFVLYIVLLILYLDSINIQLIEYIFKNIRLIFISKVQFDISYYSKYLLIPFSYMF